MISADKKCPKCLVVKPIAAFYSACCYCIPCRNAMDREKYCKNPEPKKASTRRYRNEQSDKKRTKKIPRGTVQ